MLWFKWFGLPSSNTILKNQYLYKCLRLYKVLQQLTVCVFWREKKQQHRNKASQSFIFIFYIYENTDKRYTNIKSDCSASLYHIFFLCRYFTNENVLTCPIICTELWCLYLCLHIVFISFINKKTNKLICCSIFKIPL